MAALTLLVSSLRATALHPLPHLDLQHEALVGLTCSRAGQVTLSVQSAGTAPGGEAQCRLEQYSLQSEFQLRGGWMAPVVSRLAVPPDAYVSGDQVLQQRSSRSKSSTVAEAGAGAGAMPLVLLLHSDSQVYQPGQYVASSSALYF